MKQSVENVSAFTASVVGSRGTPTKSVSAALGAEDSTAFVLLGGGSRGAAQAGSLAVVLEQGIRPDVIIGVSAGAWNGAYLAADPTPERAHALCAIWASLKTPDLLGSGWWHAAVHVLARRSALYSAEGQVRVARRYLDRQRFEDLDVPLYLLAANVTTGRPTLFSCGRLLPAMLASSAVPGIFPPVIMEGQVYVDGGLLEWDACAAALALGAQHIYLFGCGSIRALPSRLGLPSAVRVPVNDLAPQENMQAVTAMKPGVGHIPLREVLERSWEVISHYQFQRATEGLRSGGAQVISIDPQVPAHTLPLDFNRGAALIAAGRAAAEAGLRAEPESPARTVATLVCTA